MTTQARSRRRRWCRQARRDRGTGPDRIFISYRRSESWAEAKLLHDGLVQRFGAANVFFDTDRLQAGEPFPDRIEGEIEHADVFLLVIGDRWQTIEDDTGRRRLDNPEDWVRHEIELARAGNLRLIPVLVRGASMPRPDDLPEGVQWVCFRQAVVMHDIQWDRDMEGLATRLRKAVPRNRFASLEELRTLAPLGRLVANALAKPCAAVLALGVAAISIWRGPVFLAIGAISYLLLSVTTFFTLAEAEWVGSRLVDVSA